ncbi:MAG TPA: hypothetical protein VKH34_14845 [Vicinamibacterales bacterium]|nr:hypothetical protein [Vicinamibacterales bacterium]
MNLKQSMKLTVFVLGVVALIGLRPSGAAAQAAHAHSPAAAAAAASASAGQMPPEQDKAGALVRIVRDATERFQDVEVAKAEGYALQFGCVSGSDSGAMGMHFVNGALVGDPEIDPTRPEIVIYEPQPNGRLKLVGADFLVLADAWNAKHAAPPQLKGQLFHLFEAPNRFGLPAFYTLHVWAWKDNPTGSFVNWHANVSCNAFSGKQD